MFHPGMMLFFSFPLPPPLPPEPRAPALRNSQPKWVASRPSDTSASFSPPRTIFQNKGVLKLLIIILGRSERPRRLGGGSGRPDCGELQHAEVSRVQADCDAAAAALAAKPQDGTRRKMEARAEAGRGEAGRGADGDVEETMQCLRSGSDWKPATSLWAI